MAVLEHQETQVRAVLLTRHLVGRSSLAHLRLGEQDVSAEHALVAWNGREWEVHDLGSRNGTTLDGRRLEPGARAPLSRGAVVGFGGPRNHWRLVDDGPPSAMARPLDGGEPTCAEHGLLALPGADEPEVTVFRDEAGEWIVERDGGAERTADQWEVVAGGRRYTLHLPDVVSSTREGEALVSGSGIGLRFAVSRDEEFIEVTALAGGREIALGARAHHALLLALARARLQDQEEAARTPPGARLPATSHGWVYQEDVAKGLRLDEMHLNVSVYRCRQQLAAAGLEGAAAIIERRKPTRQLRLGVGRIEIRTV